MQPDNPSLAKPIGQWSIKLLMLLALVSGAVYAYRTVRIQPVTPPSEKTPTPKTSAIVAVTALGRLEPAGEVIHLSAPTALGNARLSQLMVDEGDRVHTGQVIAVLDGYDQRSAALEQARNQVEAAQAKLNQIQAGAKGGDIEAQKATIARLATELDNAKLEFERNRALYQEGAISASLLDSKQLVVATTQKQLTQAQATLESIAEVRPVDTQLAQAEVNSAITAVKQARAELDLMVIRSPKNGQILKIHTRPGEVVGQNGIAELGQTDQMYVVAEVYETDIGKIRLGQKGIISSPALSDKLQGTVAQIGLQVSQQSVFSVSPIADTDRKIVEVKIRIDDRRQSREIAGLTNMQVEVTLPIKAP